MAIKKDDEKDLKTLLSAVGKRIQTERKKKGWTHDELSERARKDGSFVRDADWIARFEKGEIKNVWMSDVVALSVALGLAASAHLTDKNGKKRPARRRR